MTTKNEDLGVGKEVLSYCGKCKLALAHIILDMKDETTIGKCQCKTCKAKHNYRDPEAPTKRKSRATTAATVSPEELWKNAVAKTDGNAKPYAMDKKFTEGDLIDHATLGKGVVTKLVPRDKIEVQFKEASKLLICANE